ncbi:ATPase AAA [Pilimelia anulata]|uniref:ATPase AAA n=1 Tax=Pilimelia anulata TaxID=53371 RepID=A0A8J3B4N6_9ACTN|nr:ATP-binding protein [Pilimelia anulata]GGJ95382.1 ATPase AAA [Pilimelia anulata]
MQPPATLIGRDREWSALDDFLSHPDPHVRIAVLSGRRRVGKSYLLRALAAGTGGLFVTGVAEEDSRAARLRLAGDIARYAGVGVDLLGPDASWEELLRTAVELVVRHGGPGGLLVIDELPYWLAHSPQVVGVLQLLYDRSRAGDGPGGGRVVLCGSAMSVMRELLSGTKALRGRAVLDLRLDAFDLPTTAGYWGVEEPAAALHLHAILGGSPGYRDLAPRAPRRQTDVAGWVAGTVLNPGQALYSRSETEYLLREDPKFTGSALHYGILGAVAAGASSPAKIGGLLGRDRTTLTRPIDALVAAGFLRRDVDPLWERRTVLTLADPIVRFHHAVTVPRYELVETGGAAAAWRDARPAYSARVVGPHFEYLAREWLRRHAPAELRERSGLIAAAVVRDTRGRAQHEIDVLGLRSGGRRAEVTVIGEAKATVVPRGHADIDRLDRIRAVLSDRGHRTDRTRLVLFSMYGFAEGLRRTAPTRADLLLVDLAAMVRGAD